MESLKKILLKIDDFDNLKQYLLHNSIIIIAQNILNKFDLSTRVRPRDFLSAFIIYKFRNDNIINTSYSSSLLESCIQLIENTVEENLGVLILDYTTKFKIWKNQDYHNFVNELFFSYHKISINILNSPLETHHELKNIQKSIMQSAKEVGGTKLIKHILSYKPVVIDLEMLVNNYSKAYWDKVRNNYLSKNYDDIIDIFTNIRNLYCTLYPSLSIHINETIDLSYIKYRFDNKIAPFEEKELLNICYNIIQITEQLQSPERDNTSKELKIKILQNNIDFITCLSNIVDLTNIILQDLENLRALNKLD